MARTKTSTKSTTRVITPDEDVNDGYDDDDQLQIDQEEEESERIDVEKESANTLMAFADLLCREDKFQPEVVATANLATVEEIVDAEEPKDDSAKPASPKKIKRKREAKKKSETTPTPSKEKEKPTRKRGRPTKNSSEKSAKRGKTEDIATTKKGKCISPEIRSHSAMVLTRVDGKSIVFANIPFSRRSLDNQFLTRKTAEVPSSLSILDSAFVKTMDEFKKHYSGSVMYKLPPPVSIFDTKQAQQEKRAALANGTSVGGYKPGRDQAYNRNSAHIAIAYFIFHQEGEKKKNQKNPTNQISSSQSKLIVGNANSISNRPSVSPSQRNLAQPLAPNPMGFQMPFQNTMNQSPTTAPNNYIRASPFNPAAAAFANPITPQMMLQTYPGFGFHTGAFNPSAMAAAANFSKQQSPQQPPKRNTNTSTPIKK